MPKYSGIWTLSQVNQAIKNLDWEGTPPTVVEYLVVAGGGGGGSIGGGGGGAGGLLQGYAGITTGSSYYVTVGSGGAGSTLIANRGVNGNASVFDAASSGASTGRIIAIGGGGGGSSAGSGVNSGAAGGSGGGANYDSGAGGSGTSGQGNAGAGVSSGSPNYYCGSGGGGAGTVGLPETQAIGSGIGGAGIASDITGTRAVYAGGGGGGGNNGQIGCVGGVGGGGTGGKDSNSVNATNGTTNTGGGGGGGGGGYPGFGTGATGGSGIVVIRYPGNVQYFTGGTLNYSNGHIVHTFLSSGVLAPTAPRLFATPDYQIARSLRFNSADSAYLSRTPSSAGNRKTWTWSAWVKRVKSGGNDELFVTNSFDGFVIRFVTDDTIRVYSYSGGYQLHFITTAVYRDFSAWYHVILAIDSTQSSSTDRAKLYVNGAQVTSFSAVVYPSQNQDLLANQAQAHVIGSNNTFGASYANVYMTELNFIDGQQLTPASFGYVEPSTKVWTPLQYTGSYGTNGFYLNFADNSNTTAVTLGKDLSGNGNNFTPYNFSVSAGVDNDSLVDSPTNYGVDTGAGGEVRGNYCTLNPLIKPIGTVAYSNGNLVATNSTSNWNAIGGTIGITTGKWYWEYISGGQNTFFGIMVPTINFSSGNPQDANAAAGSVLLCDDNKYQIDYNARVTYTSTAHPSGTIVGIAVDIDAGTIVFYINGVSQGTITWTSSAAYGKTVIPMAVAYDSGYVTTANFGQRPFSYTAPSGYKALCTQNLPESGAGKLPGKYFGIATYPGTSAYNVIATGIDAATNGGMVWLQARTSGTHQHDLIDSVRGYTKLLDLPSQAAESTYNANITATNFGFTISDNSNQLNGSSFTYVGWNWAGGGTAVTNTVGSITSTISANPQAGFSVVTYTGNGANSTVGHGLGIAPKFMIVKQRNTVRAWIVYHNDITATKFVTLDTTDLAQTAATFWNSTAPTSTVFSIGNDGALNTSGGTYVAYCWAEVPGYSKFGSYVGNGAADGTFVYCGFRPAYVLIKNITNAADWRILDSARNTYNVIGESLQANNTTIGTNFTLLDFLSNGFKLRNTFTDFNLSANTYIFAAFAESPLKYARAR